VYGFDDRLRGLKGDRRVLLLHPDDAAEAALRAGQAVDLTSHFRGETRTLRGFRVVPYDVPRRCAAAYFPEANGLVRSRARPIAATRRPTNPSRFQ
jgi:anaerobic selenocysteine-containing dehydrogenase